MRIAVLALQGAFIEHERMLERLGVESFEVRQLADWQQSKDALIIPGGESTTQLKLLKELGLLQPIRNAIDGGMPVFGTCAGLILLAKEVEGEDFARISTMDMRVKRNAYGRQLGSFATTADFRGIGTVPMTFIRAPFIDKVYGDTEIMATVGGHIVAGKEKNQLATAFHPELNDDTRLHSYFIDMVRNSRC